ncbi:MAG: cation:proton antiporter [Chromatiales bacterium]|jgi:CPA1 family monovalent cation:H+ antiporter|nr:cation:proton antiporter [Chromatiales bacterium]
MIVTRFLAMLLASAVLIFALLRPGALDALSAFTALPPAAIDAALCVLLFAAAMQLRARGPLRALAVVMQFSLFGTVLAILLLGAVAQWVFGRFGVEVSYVYCLLFAALIAPADPLAMQRSLSLAGATPGLGRHAVAESLLSSLFGLIFFSVTVVRIGGTKAGLFPLLMQQAGGGVLLGLCLGLLLLYALRKVSSLFAMIVCLAAAVIAAWALGQMMGIGAPLAAGIAGLVLAFQDDEIFGDAARRERLSDICLPWAEIATALLLLALAFKLVVTQPPMSYFGIAIFVLPIVVVVRTALVGSAVWLFGRRWSVPRALPATMAWGGLRGGMAAALALMLPGDDEATLLIQTIVFAMLAFSILMQSVGHGLMLVTKRPLSEVVEEQPEVVVDESSTHR